MPIDRIKTTKEEREKGLKAFESIKEDTGGITVYPYAGIAAPEEANAEIKRLEDALKMSNDSCQLHMKAYRSIEELAARQAKQIESLLLKPLEGKLG